MSPRIISSVKQLFNEDSPEVFEKNSKKQKQKSYKQFTDAARGKGTYIKGDPESRGKLESKIEEELEAFFDTIPDCAWWNIKESGKIQAIGKGKAVLKESKNRGFADFLLCIRGIFIMVEAKAPGRYQSPWQMDQQEKVQKKGGGFYFLVTSVREVIILFTACGVLKK